MHRVLAYVLSSLPRTYEPLRTPGGVVNLVSISIYIYIQAGDRSVVAEGNYVATAVCKLSEVS